MTVFEIFCIRLSSTHSDSQGQDMSRMSRHLGSVVAAAFAALLSGGLEAQTAETIQTSYLYNSSIGYASPTAPADGSSQSAADLDAVRTAQTVDVARRQEAFEDASAYDYDLLLPRFSAAVGTQADLQTRPILAHMLKRLLADTANYAGTAKAKNPRSRPYVEDPSIVPCETDFLFPSNDASYPSGHATNGYAAALLIADAMSDYRANRRAAIMARGVRYGENRIVCGVHHPSDVLEGQHLARELYGKVSNDAEFRKDLACAQTEDARSNAGITVQPAPAYSQDCVQRRAQYIAEATTLAAKRASAATTFGSP